MVLLKYLKKKHTISPNLDGPLSECIPSAAFSSMHNEAKYLVNAIPSNSRNEDHARITQTRKEPD